VELLVVIAIIGILIALLLPAVQAAREAARRSQCSNNLKQIGLGLHNYHDTHKTLPTGHMIWNNNTPSGCGLVGTMRLFGWQVLMLPYIEQQPLHDQFDFDTYVQISTAVNSEPMWTWIDVYLCPSNPTLVGVNWTGGTNPFSGNSNEDSTPTHYSGIGDSISEFANGVSGWPKCDGNGLFYMDSETRFRDIVDGTSNTLAVCENVGPKKGTPNQYAAKTWVSWNFMDVHNGINFPFRLVPPLSHSAWNSTNGPASYHPGGCQFLLGDGSVRFIAETVDQITLNGLATRDNGEVLGPF
jgi:type II secretory pathway pseudopilin PulG